MPLPYDATACESLVRRAAAFAAKSHQGQFHPWELYDDGHDTDASGGLAPAAAGGVLEGGFLAI
jgi:hypothetical protein